jgi:cell division inhibitor SepF
MTAFFNKALNFLGLAEEEIEESSYPEPEKNPIIDYEDYKHLYDEEEKTTNKKVPRIDRKTTSNYGRLHAIDSSGKNRKLRVTVSEPRAFEEVQEIANDLKSGVPLVINLQNTNNELSKRIIDFCSGLTYAVEGSIKKVADKVFLITPNNVTVTSGEKEILDEERFYNQL